MSETTVPAVRDPITVNEPFEVIYQREFRPMVRLATHLVDTPDQAEEVVQDAFAALYLRYRIVNNPVAYVRVCVLNGGRRVLRRRLMVRRQPMPTELHADLAFNHLMDAVRRLPSKQRDVVLLRYDLQLSDQEIAETLGIPVGTVKSTLHRALARLRTEVSE